MSQPIFSLQGMVLLITGGGSGIGRATAKAMAASGAKVALTELPGRGRLAEEVVAEIAQGGGEALALSMDVRDTLTIDNVVDQVIEHFGRLDVLVNNAGTQILKPALELEEHEFDEVMAVNLKGAFMCAQAAGRFMVEEGRGCIINVASQHGVVGNKLRAAYCASKGGLVNLTRALAVEWAKYGIRVNAVSPTFVSNESNQQIFDSLEFQEDLQRNLPLGRGAHPEEIAVGIVYLASASANMVTGHNLIIDGGWTAR
ncbi:glucose 1-dehydrogenase [uncultured Microbulbifer sp.]|uniref:SDR family NAD(P)-dependent oxidoreductase n=1 Tax=uncultured Microbulbifer sp. TaxID=348147 RepID=UPI00261A194E|nr:glucose 1-dehydrogenase [uncultured Microbulbifer sp.]